MYVRMCVPPAQIVNRGNNGEPREVPVYFKVCVCVFVHVCVGVPTLCHSPCLTHTRTHTQAFDLRDNMKEIFHMSTRAGEFSCFDGMRAISCGWVIIYHVILWQVCVCWCFRVYVLCYCHHRVERQLATTCDNGCAHCVSMYAPIT